MAEKDLEAAHYTALEERRAGIRAIGTAGVRNVTSDNSVIAIWRFNFKI